MPPAAPTNPALRLYLIRHGKAERNSATGEDEDRKLKPRGERQAKYVADRLSKEKKALALLVHSPVLRAAHTAKLICAALKCKRSEDEALSVGEPARGILAVIDKHRGAGSGAGVLAIVGHNPTLEVVAAALAPKHFKSQGVNLRTGEVLIIDLSADKGAGEGSLVGRWRLEEPEDDD